MDTSILTSVKLLLGITEEETFFDEQIISLINSAFIALYQMGVGPQSEALQIIDATTSWSSFTSDTKEYNAAKTSVYLRVKNIFDPPSSSIATAYKEEREELEYRMMVASEKKEAL